jgi:hypothetical protein
MLGDEISKLDFEIINKIATAAARLVPIGEIAAACGLSYGEWEAFLRDDLEGVRNAVLTGRIAAHQNVSERLRLASKYGKTDAILELLQRDHGWVKPKRGRPPRSASRANGLLGSSFVDSL